MNTLQRDCTVTCEAWLHVAVVLDLNSRRVEGWAWAIAAELTTELTGVALRMTLQHRRVSTGLLHHSDRATSMPLPPISSD